MQQEDLSPETLERLGEILETKTPKGVIKPRKTGSKLISLFESTPIKISLSITLFVLIFGLTFVIAYISKKLEAPSEAEMNITPEAEIKLPEAEIQLTQVDTSEWKKFSSSEDFQISYPADWKYKERTFQTITTDKKETETLDILFSPTNVFDINPGVFRIAIFKPENELDLDTFLDTHLCTPAGEWGNNCVSTTDETDELLVDIPAKRIEYHPANQYKESIVAKRGVHFYEFELNHEKPMYENRNPSPGEREEIFRKILSTLTFANQDVQGMTTSTTCLESERQLLEEVIQCKDVDENECREIKDQYKECMFACKKYLDEDLCTNVCKPTCNILELAAN